MISSHQQRLIEELQENLATVNILLVRLQKARSLAEHPKEQLSLDEQIKEAKTHKLEYENALRAVGVDPNEQQIERANPYKGLAFFRFEDRANFFGRERVSQALRELVEKFHFVALIGASGSGKSSVLQAGLRGVLAGEWLVLSCRPSMCPFAELSYAIAPLCYDGMEREEALEKLPEKLALGDIGLATLLESTRRKQDKARLLLIIDQFEELFTQNTEAVQKKFTESLQKLLLQVDSQHLPLTVLLSYRADFTEFVIRFFGERLNQTGSVFLLGKMSRAELQTAIEQPAYQAGVQLEEGLLTRILEDVSEKEGLLPLLQFALAALWDKQEALCLTHQAYAAIGGIEQALANYADNVLTKFDNKQQEDVRRIFMQLVRFGEGTEDTRQVTTQARIHDWQLVAKLADERLVVTQQAGEQGTAELVHEALIRHWQPLRQWIEADRKFRVWQENLRRYIQDKVLLQGVQLGIAQEWLKERGVELLAEERAFIEASIAGKEQREARRKRQQRLWTLMIFTFFVVALGLSIVAGWKWVESEKNLGQAQQKSIEAEERFNQSKRNQSRMLAGFAETELNNSRPATAMRLALEGLPNISETYPDRPFVTETYSILIQAMNEQYHGVFEDVAAVGEYVFHPNNKNLLTINRNAIYIWDIETGQFVRSWTAHTDFVLSASYSPDGTKIVTASQDKTAKIWDAHTGKLLFSLDGHTESVSLASYSPDNSRIVTASRDDTTKVWDANTGKLLFSLTKSKNNFNSASYSPNGSQIITLSWDEIALENVVNIWDANIGKLLFFLKSEDSFSSASYSPDSKHIVTVSSDDKKTISIWDANTGKLFFSFEHTHTKYVKSIKYNTSGTQIVTVSYDNTVKIWDVKTKKLLSSHEIEEVFFIGYSSDGLLIATSFYNYYKDITITRVSHVGMSELSLAISTKLFIPTKDFEPYTPELYHNLDNLPSFLAKEGYVSSAMYSPNGTRIITIFSDENAIFAKIWDVNTGKQLFSLKHIDRINSAVYNLDGTQIITASDDKTAVVWDANTGKLITTLPHKFKVYNAGYDTDNKHIITVMDDGNNNDLYPKNIPQIWLIFPTLEETVTHIKKMLPPRQSTDPRDAGIENFRLTCKERQQFFLDEIERCKAKP